MQHANDVYVAQRVFTVLWHHHDDDDADVIYGWACLHSCQPNNLTKISKLIAYALMKMKNYSLKYNVCQLAIHL